MILMGVVAVTFLLIGMGAGGLDLSNFQESDVVATTYRSGDRNQKVAIIPVTGLIDNQQAAFFSRCVHRAIHDPNVYAVVLRVDSGGGMVSPSDEMWRDVKSLKDAGKYVVASYGSIAASGGYYMSAPAHEIYAQHTTITGSIGVMGGAWTFRGLLEEKLGIKPEVITATGSPDKDVANNLYRDWTEADRTSVRKLLNSMHERFTDIVIEGREGKLSEDEARALCTGKVFTAEEAKRVKLIDAIGYLDEAVDAAIAGAEITYDAKVEYYEQRVSLAQMLGAGVNQRGGASVQMDSETIQRLMAELSMPRLMYLYQPSR